jgi:hypothetical protein
MTGRSHRDVLKDLQKKNDDAKTGSKKTKDSVKNNVPVKTNRIANTKNK